MTIRPFLACLLSLCALVLSFGTVQAADAPAPTYDVAILSVTAPGKDGPTLRDFLKTTLERDHRYVVRTTQDDKTTHTLKLTVTRDKTATKIVLDGSALKGKDGNYESSLPAKAPLAAIESDLLSGLRELFDYQPPKRKALIKIYAKAADGETDGGLVETAIQKAIARDFDVVPADPYKYPIKEENMPALLKGDKKQLALFAGENPVDVIFVGTIQIPAVKNVGGATANRYQGTANIRINGWDVKRQVQVSQVTLTLKAEGVFSELVYSLTTAAGEKSAAEIMKDCGIKPPKPAPAAPAPAKEESEGDDAPAED